MIEKVRKVIFEHEGKTEVEHSSFFEIVTQYEFIIGPRVAQPLHCLAHSLNPR